MSDKLTLTCPIRGLLKTGAKSKDGLKPSEEYFRVEAIKHLLKLGYPKENFKIEAVVKRFGNSGRNSFRADLAVLDIPANILTSGDVDALLDHAVLLCEIKREHKAQKKAKDTQVKPLLDFAKLDNCVALYWDDVDQRVFWYERDGSKKVLKEGPLAILPKYGDQVTLKPLTFGDTLPSDNLLDLFSRIENILHQASIDLDQRFSVMLQLLLAKLFDEHGHQQHHREELDIQDYKAMGNDGKTALKNFNLILEKAVNFYQRYLPKTIEKNLPSKVTGDVLMDICQLLAPVRVIASRRDVIQSFYMKFAKGLYKWDLAQFFTPPPVTDFIVDILNPQFGEHLKDPACGSADFLIAAFHKRRESDPRYADCIWGTDNSKNAVQVAVLNMLLNGDGKSNIKEADSLSTVNSEKNQYEIVVCNPPFGVRITEKNKETLRLFDLGHEWVWEKDKYKKTDDLLAAQETGMLFVEACVKQTKNNGGRIGIILPNGYLANRSKKYRVLREWLLKHCRVAAICSFPRFTFKTSGADVSASIVYLEKRAEPLESVNDIEDYHFSVQMIENVGWNLGDKKAAPRYLRNLEDGSYIINEQGDRSLDADFANALQDLRRSQASQDFPWLTKGIITPNGKDGWSIPISAIIHDADLTLDPKRLCKKFSSLQDEIRKKKFFRLGDVVDFLPEQTTSQGNKVKCVAKNLYQYIEIQDIGFGDYKTTEYRGWELPSRAKHFTEPNDIYIGSIWGSVIKWCLIPNGSKDIVVTNGCHRLRLKKGKEKYLADLISFFCTEAWAVQMRAYARGSDGLAEVTVDDASNVLIIELSEEEREQIQPYVQGLLSGIPSIYSKVRTMMGLGEIDYPTVPDRPSHVVLV